jgi:hypothetical protein
VPRLRGAEHFLAPEVEPEELGSAVLACLARSRFVKPGDDAWEEFTNFRARAARYDEWVRSVLNERGYKTKSSFFRNMKLAHVERRDAAITIRPTRHERSDAWSGDGISEESIVRLAETARPDEIGAAVRLAFTRCI